jgi:hypothetical protein
MSDAASPRPVVRPAPHPASADTVEQIPPPVVGIDIVEEWGLQSFPASDPPANW